MAKKSKLLLFDVDCTLVNTGGAGISALNQAIVEVFGNEGPPLDLAGSTDSGIVRGLFEHFGQSYDALVEEQFYEVYLPLMKANLRDEGFGGRVLDGVPELLGHLENEGHILGLLTGNIERGGLIKVAHYGLAEHFQFGSYGDDHWDRNKLGPIAIDRANEHTGKHFTAGDVIVIGDTCKDVACAQAIGAPCLAVATGSVSADALAECGADLVVRDLTVPEVREFLGLLKR
ncbi:HAD hydrolase-like protein [Akkermansiaceae bacterium]|nr:HAD hydrolase-like protein [Akkermansiaceae bacterium]